MGFRNMGTGKHTSFYELRDALAEEGCPICRLARKSVASFLDNLIYENVNDPGIRDDIREARGFCNLHAWQLRDHGGALGIAIIHRDVIETLMQRVKEAEYQPASWLPGLNRRRTSNAGEPVSPATVSLVADLRPQRTCPACQRRDRTVHSYIGTLLQYIDDAELGQMLRESQGLCLPHFRQALQQVSDEPTFKTLTNIQLEIWRGLRDELSEFIRKQDYRFRDESLGAEGTAWSRAIAQISGLRGVG